MGQIDPTLRTPAAPFVIPRVPGYREEKRRHDDSQNQPEENPDSGDNALDPPQEDHSREDENKGTKIDIQI